MENALHKYHEMMNVRSNFPFHFSCYAALLSPCWWNAAVTTMTSETFICITAGRAGRQSSHIILSIWQHQYTHLSLTSHRFTPFTSLIGLTIGPDIQLRQIKLVNLFNILQHVVEFKLDDFLPCFQNLILFSIMAVCWPV